MSVILGRQIPNPFKTLITTSFDGSDFVETHDEVGAQDRPVELPAISAAAIQYWYCWIVKNEQVRIDRSPATGPPNWPIEPSLAHG